MIRAQLYSLSLLLLTSVILHCGEFPSASSGWITPKKARHKLKNLSLVASDEQEWSTFERLNRRKVQSDLSQLQAQIVVYKEYLNGYDAQGKSKKKYNSLVRELCKSAICVASIPLLCKVALPITRSILNQVDPETTPGFHSVMQVVGPVTFAAYFSPFLMGGYCMYRLLGNYNEIKLYTSKYTINAIAQRLGKERELVNTLEERLGRIPVLNHCPCSILPSIEELTERQSIKPISATNPETLTDTDKDIGTSSKSD